MAQQSDRFGGRIERQDGKDFPFYNGKPIAIEGWQWLVIVASVILGFSALLVIPASDDIGALIPRALFTLIPLITLAYFAKNHWKALFSRPEKRDYKAMLGFAVLNIAVSLVIAGIVKVFFDVEQNPATDGLSDAGFLEIAAFYVGTFVQILGEELLTILPFLAILYYLYAKKKVSRKKAIIAAWAVTSLWFGALHLPTYGWDVPQALLVIGGARVILTLAYVKTKNLWVSFGAHLVGDWTLFTLAIL